MQTWHAIMLTQVPYNINCVDRIKKLNIDMIMGTAG